MSLLPANGWKAVSGALCRMEEMSLERTLGDRRVRVSAAPEGRGWTVAMPVRAERRRPWWYETQYFESVEEA